MANPLSFQLNPIFWAQQQRSDLARYDIYLNFSYVVYVDNMDEALEKADEIIGSICNTANLDFNVKSVPILEDGSIHGILNQETREVYLARQEPR